MNNQPCYWSITLIDNEPARAIDAETISLELVENGALGANVSSDGIITFYLSGDEGEVKNKASELLPPNCSCTFEMISDTNWITACEDILRPVPIGSLTVCPITEANQSTKGEKNIIFVIPGMGFGTGHHETTRTVISALQEPQVKESFDGAPQVLDVGTGSGILAIAVAKLFDASVDAIDIDLDALANARENAAINEVSNNITFSDRPLHEFTNPCDLIIANIYAEVLVTMEPHFYTLLSSGRPLILSGIMESRVGLLTETFTELRWGWLVNKAENGWITLLLRRR